MPKKLGPNFGNELRAAGLVDGVSWDTDGDETSIQISEGVWKTHPDETTNATKEAIIAGISSIVLLHDPAKPNVQAHNALINSKIKALDEELMGPMSEVQVASVDPTLIPAADVELAKNKIATIVATKAVLRAQIIS